MYKLYHNIGYRYPPNVLNLEENKGAHLAALTAAPSAKSAGSGPKLSKAVRSEIDLNDAAKPPQEDKKSTAGKGKETPSEETKKKLASLEKKMPAIAAKSATSAEEEETKEDGIDGDKSDAFAGDETSQAVAKIAKQRAALGSLFSGLVFYISREVPYETMELCLLSFGAAIEAEDPDSAKVTHHVTDRTLRKLLDSRDYVQPQWVFDCINASMLLPIARYHPQSKDLPPHLSPFVDDAAEGYTPLYAEEIKRLRAARNASASAPALVADHKSGLESLLERNNERDPDSESDQDDASKPRETPQKPKPKSNPPSVQDIDESSDESDESEEAKEEDEHQAPEEQAYNEKKSFLASHTFQGSKRGWVFRSGPRGVGYYIDTNAKRTIMFRPSKGLSKRAQRKKNKLEAHKRGEMMMSKKAKRLYDRMQHGIKKKNDQIDLLKRKRDQRSGDKAKRKKKNRT